MRTPRPEALASMNATAHPTPRERLHALLCEGGLTQVGSHVEAHLQRAGQQSSSYTELLVGLLAEEAEGRSLRVQSTRLRRAGLPYQKTLKQFDFAFQPSIDHKQRRELRTMRFVSDAANVIFLGPPGVGKTHLAIGLAIEAIRQGHSAYFVTAQDLVGVLGAAAREGRLALKMKTYLRPKVLLIEEVGYLPLDALGATILFQLISARYERGSIVLTSNKSYTEWGHIFAETTIATAILDRLLHHSTPPISAQRATVSKSGARRACSRLRPWKRRSTRPLHRNTQKCDASEGENPMPTERIHKNAAERQAAYRVGRPEKKMPREDLRANLARSLHYTIEEALDHGTCPLPRELLGARADVTMKNRISCLHPNPDPVRFYGMEGMPRA
jgi:DNA replication protein DnaC